MGRGVSLTPPPSYFKKNLSNINITLYNCYSIYLKYVESEKMLTKKKKKKNPKSRGKFMKIANIDREFIHIS